MATQREIKERRGGAVRRKKYVKPKVITCSAQELLEQLVTARACSHAAGSVLCDQIDPN